MALAAVELADFGLVSGLADVETATGRFAAARGARSASEYWNWGNPAVREVTRNVLGVGGTTGAVAGAGYLLSSMLGRKRQRVEEDMNNGMDDLPVLGGDRTNVNRVTQKRVLKRGRIGRKLNKEHEQFVQRWQRIYPYGDTADSRSLTDEQNNPGCNNVANWPTTPVPQAVNCGRLVLSHVTGVASVDAFQFMPGYLFDITCWQNTSNTYAPIPCKRMGLRSDGNFQWVPVAQNFNSAAYIPNRMDWGPESGPSGTGAPTSTEQKALLSWSDIRLMFYGARNVCTKVTIEFIQFKEPMYQMNFHPDGEAVTSMSALDQYAVNEFWFNEFKKRTFNPIDVQSFNRKQAITVLHSETFCINSENKGDNNVDPIGHTKQYFKRFNRLVNWNWAKPAPTVGMSNAIDNPDFLQGDQGALLGYTNPKARIFLYIKAEHFTPVLAGTVLTSAVDREVSFDMVIRNKWRIQT